MAMAKKLKQVPEQFEELEKALRGSDRSGWSIGSAEGGWATPTKDEWGRKDGWGGKRRKTSRTSPPGKAAS